MSFTSSHPAIKKILIGSDFLMTKEKEQFSNLRWLYELLKNPITDATGIEPEQILSSLSREGYFSRTRFFSLSGIELDIEKTQFYFDDARIAQGSLDYLREFVHPGCLVIGYELSEQTRRLLTQMGVIYVDLWLHPIRFLDDILFGFSSNDESVFAALSQFNIDPKVYRMYADRLKIQSFKGFKRTEYPIIENSALFVGQTLEDKAVCRDGQMLSLLDFKEEFEDAGKNYGAVYYSRHPYVKSGDEEILKYLKSRPFARIVDWPAYHMLASRKLAHVFSISSSVVFEAHAFGKSTAFLFKPVIDLSVDFGLRSYVSVYQEFVSPHFWSSILASILPTAPCPRIAYLDGKDKLRDMLAFYWSYKHIDKTENMRAQLSAVDQAVQTVKAAKKAAPKPVKAPPPPPLPKVIMEDGEKHFADAVALFNDYDVISFDIFDTLLVRPFAKPDDLFTFMHPAVAARNNGVFDDFRKARLEAKKFVPEEFRLGEEVPLRARYIALEKQFSLPDGEAEALLQMELGLEARMLKPRHYVKRLFDEAIRLQKRVIIISDTFFDKPFIEMLLKANGFAGYERLFVSSEFGLLKATGNLYPAVVQALGVEPGRILHIGDNAAVDIAKAKEKGLAALHVPATVKAFEQKTRLAGKIAYADPIARSLHVGLSANRIADNPSGISTPAHTNGDLTSFGYSIFGPILLGFASWVLREAGREGISRLYFLARDGDIVMRACRALADVLPDCPESSYLYASRRGVNVPALASKDDIKALLQINFSPMRLGALLENRFGVSASSIDAAVFQRHGFTGADDVVRQSSDLGRLEALTMDVADLILANARAEREVLLDYFEAEGLFDANRKKGIVDIGHNGTMQSSIAELIGSSELHGYYFATFDGIRDIHARGMSAKGYLGDAIPGKDKRHPYVKHILMFELLFLNEQGSFIRMQKQGHQFTPELLSIEDEASRVDMIRKVHAGALEFVRDAVQAFGAGIENVSLSGMEVIQPYSAFLSAPSLLDARMFSGVVFENKYSGRDIRHVVSDGADKNIIWEEGTSILRAYAGNKKPQVEAPSGASAVLNVGRALVALNLMTERKYEKLRRSPSTFFADSRNPLTRLAGRALRWSKVYS